MHVPAEQFVNVAAIDCGTNSIRLLIAAAGEPLTDLHREMRVVRLGQDVDRTGRFHPRALARTLEAVTDYARLIAEHDVARVRFVATSATRDAANKEEFIAGVHQRLGVTPEVITGQEEAALSFAGAIRVAPQAPEPVLVVDLGGGSTELVLGAGSGPLASFSMDVGCVRIHERHLATDPPTPAEVAAARTDVRAALTNAGHAVPLREVRTLVGVAGTITTVTAHALGLDSYDPERINGARLSVADIDAACTELLTATRDQRAALPFMHPGRVDVIGAGALVWQETVRAAQVAAGDDGRELGPVLTSEHDILDGIALSISDRETPG